MVVHITVTSSLRHCLDKHVAWDLYWIVWCDISYLPRSNRQHFFAEKYFFVKVYFTIGNSYFIWVCFQILCWIKLGQTLSLVLLFSRQFLEINFISPYVKWNWVNIWIMWNTELLFSTFLVVLSYPIYHISCQIWYLGWYDGCRCPGSLRRQSISGHSIIYVR